MKKQILAGLILGATVGASAHTTLIDKVFTGGIRDAAMDTKGNLFVVNGDGSAIHKIDHNGNIVWTFNPGVTFHQIAVNSLGQVGSAYTSMGNLGICVNAGFTGTYIESWPSWGTNPDEYFDLVGSDAFYLGYRVGTDSHLFSSGFTTLVSSASAPLEMAADPLGGLAVAIRGTSLAVNHYILDTVDSEIELGWQYTRPDNFTAEKAIRLNYKANGKLLMGYVYDDFGVQYQGIRLDTNGVAEDSAIISTNDTQYHRLPRPIEVQGTDAFFDQYVGRTEALYINSGSFDPLAISNAEAPTVGAAGANLLFFENTLLTESQSDQTVAQSNWTKPTNYFEALPRPDGTFWVVEHVSTNARLVRVAPGPKLTKDFFVMNEDQAGATFNVLTNDAFDWVGGTNTIEWQNLPTTGLGAVSNEEDSGDFTFTPNADQSGAVDFNYRVVNSTHGASPWQSIRVVVKPINDRPVGNADTYTVQKGQTLAATIAEGVLNNDTDADNHTLTAVLHRIPQRGSLNLASNGSFSYQAPMQVGTYTFLYRAKDVSMHCAPVTVTIHVTN